MIFKRNILICLLVYFISVYIFFKSQFVSYQQIQGYQKEYLTNYGKKQMHVQRIQKGNYANSISGDKELVNNDLKEEDIDSSQKDIITSKNKLQNFNQTIPQVSQVVLIIIDALRYDYLKKMTFFNKTLQKHPKTTIIKKSIVGVPTMTTQRIQSLMTGSQIFTSTNILDMFLSSQSKVDNLIDQLNRRNRSVKVFGDDTWKKLFRFGDEDSFVCDSTFNIKDYDGCDNLIYDNLHKFIKRVENKDNSASNNSNNEPQLLIAHFLSIDHIGHSTSSITSPQILKKMDRMSSYFQYLIKISQNDTMFIITGDHGMRQDGNHGGSTNSQTQTILFAHYKSQGQHPKENFNKRLYNLDKTFVNQVDITPTLSLLLGVPNPVNSIGYPIVEILPFRYSSYLPTIQYNILEGYKNIILHYNKDLVGTQFLNITKPTDQNYPKSTNINAKCLQKISQLQTHLSTQIITNSSSNPINNNQSQSSSIQTQQQQTFRHYLQRKQYIKSQIQLSKCLANQLSFTKPDSFGVWVGLVSMGLSFVWLVVGIYWDDIGELIRFLLGQQNCFTNQKKEIKQRNQIIINKIMTLVLQFIGLFGSLFVIYFSWYLIRNSSTYMLILIYLYILLIPNKTIPLINKLSILGLLLTLTQFQKQKINEYELNYFNFQINKFMLGHENREQFQGMQLSKRLKVNWLVFLVINVWFLCMFKRGIGVIKKMNRRIVSQKKKNEYKLQQKQRQLRLRQDYKELLKKNRNKTIIQVIASILLYVNMISPVVFKQQQQQSSTTQALQYVYYLRYAILVLTVIRICQQVKIDNKNYYFNNNNNNNNSDITTINNKKQQSNHHSSNSNSTNQPTHHQHHLFDSLIQFIIIIIFGIIFGYQDFLVLIIYFNIIKEILSLGFENNKNNSYGNKSNDKSRDKSFYNRSNYSLVSSNKVKLLLQSLQTNLKGKVILITLITQYMWWILGNRYQYSSIDIKKSYVWSQNFNILLNGIMMVVWFLAPHLIAILMSLDYINLRIQEEIRKQQNGYERQYNKINQTQEQQQRPLNNNSSEGKQDSSIRKQNYDNNQQQNNHNQNRKLQQQTPYQIQPNHIQSQPPQQSQPLLNTIFQSTMTKFILVSLSGLLSASINLYYNNQKILFTVVYVPLMIFGMVKAGFVCLVVFGLVLIKGKGNNNKW